MDLAHLDAVELDRLIDDARRERRRRAGTSLICEHCGVAFAARAGAKYCSGTCRVNAHRERTTAMWDEQGGMIGIGYEGITPEQLVDSLKKWGVKTLVDVRLNAISRKRGFSKKALAELLAEAGIGYAHVPALGNPRENRAAFGELDTDNARSARATFRDLLEEAPAVSALGELSTLASKQHVAVFCYEKSELHCHRHEVLAAARDRVSV